MQQTTSQATALAGRSSTTSRSSRVSARMPVLETTCGRPLCSPTRDPPSAPIPPYRPRVGVARSSMRSPVARCATELVSIALWRFWQLGRYDRPHRTVKTLT